MGSFRSTAYADTMIGNDAANILQNSAGQDEYHGGGDDLVDGRSGNDRLDGRAGTDTIIGATGADALNGGDGDDNIAAGGGNDAITGGLGVDRLSGSGGCDAFVFGSAAEGGDIINRYDGADDVVQVSAAGFGGGLVAGMNLVAGGRYIESEGRRADSPAGVGQFIFETDRQALYWGGDGRGGEGAVLVARFVSATGWAGSEIVVIA